jgi:TPR repeat protein
MQILASAIRTVLLAAIIAMGVGSAAVAGPYEDAFAAYERQDYATAMRLWQSLADQGDAKAQYNLGNMYADGEGVAENDAEAVKWYRKVADQGDARAQHNLGVMYAEGEGVPEDDAQAYKWWNLAAAQGIEEAKGNKAIVEKTMTREQIAEAQRLSTEWKPIGERD